MGTDERTSFITAKPSFMELHGLSTRLLRAHIRMNTTMYSDAQPFRTARQEYKKTMPVDAQQLLGHRSEAAVQTANFPNPAHCLNWLTSRNQFPHSISSFTNLKILKRCSNQIAQFSRIRLLNFCPEYPSIVDPSQLLMR